MKGTNDVAASFNQDGSQLLVTEVFKTLQGEGPDAGRPCVFVRLSRCNLRCFWCDTNFEDGRTVDVRTLVHEVMRMMPATAKLVVITGGEPLLQNVIPFVETLNKMGYAVSIETAGTTYLDGLDKLFAADRSINDNLIVCSPKTPQLNQQLADCVGAWKYIINDTEEIVDDGLPVNSTQRMHTRAVLYRPSPRQRNAPIYVQPRDDDDNLMNEANLKHAALVALKHGYRLSVQMHKLAGLP